VGDDMLHSLYRIADLCIVPSIYEPFGIVALEAMASGCLCVVADTGGLREVVPGDGTVGLRFPSRDSAALQEILETVLTDERLRAQLVAEAREHVLRFDWGEVARLTRDLYGRVSAASAVR
jgi:glycogen(starch) synthase